jgi:flagellar biosynthesis/type III secretory pathway protein FliH
VLLPARLPNVTVLGVMDLKEVKSMLAERVMEWTRQWEQEGFQKGYERGFKEGYEIGFKEGYERGLKEGREKRLEKARSALIEVIEQRFGPVPEAIRQQIAAMGSIRELVLAVAPLFDALGIT